MPHTVEVDLSAKVEQWSKDTAVAFSDGIRGSIFIRHKTKKAARDWLKTRYPDRSQSFYKYLLFSALIYLLIKPYLEQIERIVVDLDYSGRKSKEMITNFLLNFFQSDDPSLRGSFIEFKEVKGSKADLLARELFERSKKGRCVADRKIGLDDIRMVFPKKK